MGDAVNWDWLVECAISTKRSVIIVSRDNDYGFTFEKLRHVNSWLAQEFTERVGPKVKLTLTDSLSAALEELDVQVTQAEREAEEELIESTHKRAAERLTFNDISSLLPGKTLDLEKLTMQHESLAKLPGLASWPN
jgi:hypothetical protein